MCARVRKQRTSDSGLIWKGGHIIRQPPRGVGRGGPKTTGTTFALARGGPAAKPRFRGVSCQTLTADAGRRGQKCGPHTLRLLAGR